MSPLQLSIYRQFLDSKLIGSCLRRDGDACRHLEVIGVLRKVANSPGLVLAAARDTVATEQQLKRLNMHQSEVSLNCSQTDATAFIFYFLCKSIQQIAQC